MVMQARPYSFQKWKLRIGQNDKRERRESKGSVPPRYRGPDKMSVVSESCSRDDFSAQIQET